MNSVEEIKRKIYMGEFEIDSVKLQSALIGLERSLLNQLRFELEQVFRFPQESEDAQRIWALSKKYAEPCSETQEYKLKIVEIYEDLVQLKRG